MPRGLVQMLFAMITSFLISMSQIVDAFLRFAARTIPLIHYALLIIHGTSQCNVRRAYDRGFNGWKLTVDLSETNRPSNIPLQRPSGNDGEAPAPSRKNPNNPFRVSNLPEEPNSEPRTPDAVQEPLSHSPAAIEEANTLVTNSESCVPGSSIGAAELQHLTTTSSAEAIDGEQDAEVANTAGNDTSLVLPVIQFIQTPAQASNTSQEIPIAHEAAQTFNAEEFLYNARVAIRNTLIRGGGQHAARLSALNDRHYTSETNISPVNGRRHTRYLHHASFWLDDGAYWRGLDGPAEGAEHGHETDSILSTDDSAWYDVDDDDDDNDDQDWDMPDWLVESLQAQSRRRGRGRETVQ